MKQLCHPLGVRLMEIEPDGDKFKLGFIDRIAPDHLACLEDAIASEEVTSAFSNLDHLPRLLSFSPIKRIPREQDDQIEDECSNSEEDSNSMVDLTNPMSQSNIVSGKRDRRVTEFLRSSLTTPSNTSISSKTTSTKSVPDDLQATKRTYNRSGKYTKEAKSKLQAHSRLKNSLKENTSKGMLFQNQMCQNLSIYLQNPILCRLNFQI